MKTLIAIGIILVALSFGVVLAEKMNKINATEKITINATDNLTAPNASENITIPTKITTAMNATNLPKNVLREKALEISPNKTPVKIRVQPR